MDLNYLYRRHAICLAMAERAACGASRASHLGLARGYAGRIAEARRLHSATAA